MESSNDHFFDRAGSNQHGGPGQQPSPCDFREAARNAFDHVASQAQSEAQKRAINKTGRTVDRFGRKVEQVISAIDFFKSLKQVLPAAIPNGHHRPKRLRDAEFNKVADWCLAYGKPRWSERPRTFSVLYMIGCAEAIESFVEEDLSDIALPYTEANLPSAVRGVTARSQFLDYQRYVLTPHAADLEKPGGRHQNIEGSADDYFVCLKELGSGHFGEVDHVISRLSISHFARKRISRGHSFRKDREAIRDFENELRTLKMLSHRHLVKLVGSYTDRLYVGLIMTPVADMNLAKFLDNPASELGYLRRFFGCLAAAVNYLHSLQIRHKDIKPQNILVKDRRVLLADFGTSLAWSDNTKSSTNGTTVAFTPRYCAPEVARFESRNESSDIWSLGCVFLEMATVLNQKTVEEMKTFFKSNGTRADFVRGNFKAFNLWLEYIKQSSSATDDLQPLEWSQQMLQEYAEHRPTSQQVLSEILDSRASQRYCGVCCSADNDTVQSSFTDLRESETQEYRTIEPLLIDDEISARDAVMWKHPTVEDGDETIVMRVTDPEIESKATDQAGHSFIPKAQVPRTDAVSEKAGAESSSGGGTPFREQEKNKSRGSMPVTSNGVVQRQDDSKITCEWPKCSSSPHLATPFPTPEDLVRHYRSKHGVHEFGSCSIFGRVQTGPSWPNLSERPPPGLDSRKEYMNRTFTILHHLSRTPEPDEFESKREIQRKARIKTPKETASSGGQSSRSEPIDEAPSTSYEPKEVGDIASPRAISSTGFGRQDPPKTEKSVRFGLLAEDRRPKPTGFSRGVSYTNSVAAFQHFIIPEALEESGLRSPEAQTKTENGNSSSGTEGFRMPKTSMIPSYLLACTNSFTRIEIDALTPRSRISSLVPPPLFVYGSLMFPSILRACAERFISAAGVYSQVHQRRLKTDAGDWARINFSLQRAAEQMTPARLMGFIRVKPQGYSCATLTKPRKFPGVFGSSIHENRAFKDSDSSHEVRGFLIFGLSEEALKCVDYLLSDQLDQYFKNSSRKRAVPLSPFSRKEVQVDVGLKGGEIMSIDAVTFLCTPFDSLIAESQNWSFNKFIKSKTFSKLAGTGDEASFWMQEEKTLAETMGITLVLAGDALCDAVLKPNVSEIVRLLGEGDDVNAPCRGYGSALQAAAFGGDENVVELLLENRADPNCSGGHYQTALIAATVQGHDEIARKLLKAGAHILADGGQYISAIYQAVDFSDADLVHVLLEKGAWLTKDYQELLDLASERGNREISRMLKDYDPRVALVVRREEPTSASGGKRSSRDYSREDRRQLAKEDRGTREVALEKANVVRKVLLQVLVLKGTRGKWTGIKGVRILRAAFEAGVSDSLLETLRPNLPLMQKGLDYLMGAILQMNDNRSGTPSGAERPEPLPLRNHPSDSDDESDNGSDNKRAYIPRRDESSRNTSSPSSSRSSETPGVERTRTAGTAGCTGCGRSRGDRGVRDCPSCDGSGHTRLATSSSRRTSYEPCRRCRGAGTLSAAPSARPDYRCRACSDTTAYTSPAPTAPPAGNDGNPPPLRPGGRARYQSTSSLPNYPPPPYTSQTRL